MLKSKYSKEHLKVYNYCETCGKRFWAKRKIKKTCSKICLCKYRSKVLTGKKQLNKNILGDKNPNWKGGRIRENKKENGYVLVYSPDHPYKNKLGYVREHRLVFEKHLKRFLLPEERVHHKNGIRYDNRLKNLLYFSSESKHQQHHCKTKTGKWKKKVQRIK